jgi:hypothetical protein
MKHNHAAREERRIRYNLGIWTFLGIAASTIFGFILWLSGVVLEIGAELPIPQSLMDLHVGLRKGDRTV